MNIQKISLNSALTWNAVKYTDNDNTSNSKYGLKMSAPLVHDTVSFGIRKGRKTLQAARYAARAAAEKAAALEEEIDKNAVTNKELPAEQKIWKINKKDAEYIHSQILKPQIYIRNFIHNLFDDLIYSEKNPRNPIMEIHDREKKVPSIIEKTATLKLRSVQEVFDNVTDLNGVKIVMRKKAGQDEMDFVLDRFVPMIKTGQTELKEIEVKLPVAVKSLPMKEQEKYIYASMGMLKRLIEVQEGVWNTKNTSKENIRKVVFRIQYTKGNYCALHMLFDFPNNKELRVFEAQFMGAYEGEGKDLDDIVFKLLDGKEVDKKYHKIKKLIEDLKADKTGAIDRFKQYRKDAILGLRERERHENATQKTTSKNAKLFISAEKYNLTPEYDLNSMLDLKNEADQNAKNLERARQIKKEKEEAAKKESKEKPSMSAETTLSIDAFDRLLEKFNTKKSKDRNKKKI